VAGDVLATGTAPGAVNTNNTATALGAAQAQAGLSATLTAPGGASQGDTITCAVAVTDSGPSDAQGVQVVESLPANASLVVASFSQGTSALSGPNVVSALGTVPAGATVTGTLVVRAPWAPSRPWAPLWGLERPSASPARRRVGRPRRRRRRPRRARTRRPVE
jgi:uncharacterized repeat protein (TIGR01451 family)